MEFCSSRRFWGRILSFLRLFRKRHVDHRLFEDLYTPSKNPLAFLRSGWYTNPYIFNAMTEKVGQSLPLQRGTSPAASVPRSESAEVRSRAAAPNPRIRYGSPDGDSKCRRMAPIPAAECPRFPRGKSGGTTETVAFVPFGDGGVFLFCHPLPFE